jgi:uncharacterized protein HemX
MVVSRRLLALALVVVLAVLGAAVYLAAAAQHRADSAHHQLRDLQVAVAELKNDVGNADKAGSVAALAQQLDELQTAQGKDHDKLAVVCAGVSDELTRLSGEQSADVNTGARYYTDLYDVLNAVCGQNRG